MLPGKGFVGTSRKGHHHGLMRAMHAMPREPGQHPQQDFLSHPTSSDIQDLGRALTQSACSSVVAVLDGWRHAMHTG